jgi:hypothetical protein
MGTPTGELHHGGAHWDRPPTLPLPSIHLATPQEQAPYSIAVGLDEAEGHQWVDDRHSRVEGGHQAALCLDDAKSCWPISNYSK